MRNRFSRNSAKFQAPFRIGGFIGAILPSRRIGPVAMETEMTMPAQHAFTTTPGFDRRWAIALCLGQLLRHRRPQPDDDPILRRELDRMRSLSPHLLADIGIACGTDTPMDEMLVQAHRLKNG